MEQISRKYPLLFTMFSFHTQALTEYVSEHEAVTSEYELCSLLLISVPTDTSPSHYVRFHVLTAASIKMTAFSCSLIGVDRRFRGAYCLLHQGDRPAAGDRSFKSEWTKPLSACLKTKLYGEAAKPLEGFGLNLVRVVSVWHFMLMKSVAERLRRWVTRRAARWSARD
jgi:hypothetical protein